MRYRTGLVAFLVILAACVGLSLSQTVPAVTDTSLRPKTPGDLLQALTFAETHPNTTIVLTKGLNYTLPRRLNVRGDGTTLDLGGATITCNHHYDAARPDGGSAVVVMPVMGDPVPWTGQKDSLWDNEPGTVGKLEVAAGGVISLDQNVFHEPAPVQYPGELRATYTRARKIITPATNITIKNGTITTIDRDAYIALSIMWAAHVKVDGLTITGKWHFGDGELNVQESEYITLTNIKGGWIPINSSTYITIKDSDLAGGIPCEEMTRFLTVDNVAAKAIRSNDVMCSNFTVTNCTFRETDWNQGTIELWEQGGGMVFTGNKLSSPGFAGGNGDVTLKNNTGADKFFVYMKDPSKLTQVGNSWNAKP